jgi:hypothetical protein
MTRPQLQAISIAGLLALIVALSVALVMLGHATMSGGPQWSAGALGGVIILLALASVVCISVAVESAMDRHGERHQAPPVQRPPAPVYEGRISLADELLDRTAVYELDETAVDALIAQRAHHRRDRAGQHTLTRHGR